MGAQGTAVVNFGAFPGSTETSVAVSDAAILAGSLTEAWLYPSATADHSADEHAIMEGLLKVIASIPSAGVGFTIRAFAPENPGAADFDPRLPSPRSGLRMYGQWTVAWVWN